MSAPHPSSGHGNSSWPQTVAYSTATWGGGMGVAPQLIEGGRAQTLNCSICSYPKWTLQHHLARWWANLPWERGREHHGRPRWGRRATDHPPMVEDVGRTSSADRSPLRPFGSQPTGQTLPPRSTARGRGVRGLLLREGSGVLGPGALPTESVDEQPRKKDRGRHSRGDRLPQEGRAGRANASAGLRSRGSRRLGARGFVLRPLARLQGVARGARQTLRRDGPEDQRCPARGAQEEDRAARRAFGRGGILRDPPRTGR